mgnify:CR=1 FL=1
MSHTIRIGLDIGGTKTEIIALEKNNDKPLYRKRVPSVQGPERTVQNVSELVDEAEATLGRTGTVGIGIPGSLHPQTGLVQNSQRLELSGHNLKKQLEDRLKRPIRIENDANCFTLSEAIDGAGAGARLVLGLIIGTGVGGGLVFEKKLYSGGANIAGEFGHNPLPWPTREEFERHPNCTGCHGHGCIDAWVSGPSFKRDYNENNPDQAAEPLSNHDIIRCYRQGKTTAVEAFEHYTDRLARTLATLINALDPDLIVAGGGMSNIPELYEIVPQKIETYCFGGDLNTAFKPALHGDASGVRGAAWLWNDDLHVG